METQYKKEVVTIPPRAKIKVYWSDKPENYSRDSRNRVRKYFAKKYGVPNQNINVIYRPVKTNNAGEIVEIDGASIDNIMSVPYQRELFKEWLTRENKDYDLSRLTKLDTKVNGELNEDLEEKRHKKYKINWITLNNFLSFGEDNYFPVNKFKGFTLINSEPENQGGKTTLVIDSMKFLLFGKTTKTDKNIEIFNQFSENNELKVRGMLTIDGEGEIIIERVITRKPKRKGGWNVSGKLNLYKLLPDGEEEQLNDEHTLKTTELIKETVGNERDFDLVVLVTSRNLDSIVESTSGESGKLITRFIGLEVLAMKEVIAKKMYSEYTKTMKSNIYDSTTLKEEIETHKSNLEKLKEENKELNLILEKEKTKQSELTKDKIKLIESKEKIDSEILSLNPSKIEDEIKVITDKGVTLNNEHKEIVKVIDEMGIINFDEDRDFKLNKDREQHNSNIAVKTAEIRRLEQVIKELIIGGICQSCNRKLDDIDNTAHIKEHELEINNIKELLSVENNKLSVVNGELASLKEIKDKVNEKNKLELRRDRLEVELEALRQNLKSKKSDLKKYNENIDSIEKNRTIDSEISLVDTNIRVCDHNCEEFRRKLQLNAIANDSNSKDIVNKDKIIKSIEQETEIIKLYKVYIEMIGKNGISKLILRSVLPIINGELQRLLEDITDFDVEVFIDDKNEVRYLLVKDEVEKPLKSGSGFELTMSSIALRCVLGKLSSLPTPNFIAFDEVLGGRVARSNIPKLKPLFERIWDMFDIIFFISQSDLVKDWSDNIISVVKDKNISKIKIV